MLNFKNINSLTFFSLILLVYLRIQYDVSGWLIFGLIILWIVLTAIGSFHIRWNYFLKSKHQNNLVKEPVVALTFDDGPNPTYTPKVLALLKKYNAKATFFCIGKHIENYPEILKRIIEEGHTIGNHSYEHANNNGFLSTNKVAKDIKKTNQIVKNITNLDLKLFRAPFGVTNPNIAKAVKTLDLQSIGWRIRTFDTVAKNADKVFRKIKKKLNNGDILLLHDTNEMALEVLVQLLPFLHENKIKTTTVDRLFSIKAYD